MLYRQKHNQLSVDAALTCSCLSQWFSTWESGSSRGSQNHFWGAQDDYDIVERNNFKIIMTIFSYFSLFVCLVLKPEASSDNKANATTWNKQPCKCIYTWALCKGTKKLSWMQPSGASKPNLRCHDNRQDEEQSAVVEVPQSHGPVVRGCDQFALCPVKSHGGDLTMQLISKLQRKLAAGCAISSSVTRKVGNPTHW